VATNNSNNSNGIKEEPKETRNIGDSGKKKLSNEK